MHPHRRRRARRPRSCSASHPLRRRRHGLAAPARDRRCARTTSTSATSTTSLTDDEIVIVDEFTGRLMPGRRWSDGLHQAVEAKEGVGVQRGEPDPRDDHLPELLPAVQEARRHDRHRRHRGRGVLAASTSSTSSSIPTNRPLDPHDGRRPRLPHRAGEVRARSSRRSSRSTRRGRPILVGTTSDREERARLAGMLQRRGVPHAVLNAKQHDREAIVVAQAGRLEGTVTDRDQHGRPRHRHPPRGPPNAWRGRREAGIRRRAGGVRAAAASAGASCAQREHDEIIEPAASTSSAPSATSRAASTTSCAAAPAARATRAPRSSSCRSRTT